VIRLTLTASQQFNELLDHYIRLDRELAVHRLLAALREALARIEADPADGAAFPAAYRAAARWGYRWIKAHKYHIGSGDRLASTVAGRLAGFKSLQHI